jgi:hypothetical protein
MSEPITSDEGDLLTGYYNRGYREGVQAERRKVLARLGYLNDLAVDLEIASRRLINDLLDEAEPDVVDSEDDQTVGR